MKTFPKVKMTLKLKRTPKKKKTLTKCTAMVLVSQRQEQNPIMNFAAPQNDHTLNALENSFAFIRS